MVVSLCKFYVKNSNLVSTEIHTSSCITTNSLALDSNDEYSFFKLLIFKFMNFEEWWDKVPF